MILVNQLTSFSYNSQIFTIITSEWTQLQDRTPVIGVLTLWAASLQQIQESIKQILYCNIINNTKKKSKS